MTYWTIAPTPTPTILPTTTYSVVLNNITHNGFNTFTSFQDILTPYSFGSLGLSFATFIIMGAIFYSMWINHGNLKMASQLGLMFGGMFILGSGGLGIGLPLPVYSFIYGAIAASLTGWIVSTFKNVG